MLDYQCHSRVSFSFELSFGCWLSILGTLVVSRLPLWIVAIGCARFFLMHGIIVAVRGVTTDGPVVVTAHATIITITRASSTNGTIRTIIVSLTFFLLLTTIVLTVNAAAHTLTVSAITSAPLALAAIRLVTTTALVVAAAVTTTTIVATG